MVEKADEADWWCVGKIDPKKYFIWLNEKFSSVELYFL